MELHVSLGHGGRLGLELRWLALLLTYSSHALLWAAAAWWVVRWSALSSSARVWAWKAALLGPLLTTLIAAAPPWGSEHAGRAASRVPQIAVLLLSDSPGTAARVTEARAPAATDFAAALQRASQTLGIVGGCSVAALALGLVRFSGAALLLWRKLRRRSRVRDARLLQRFASTCAGFGLRGVTLSESSEVNSPLVLWRAEICIPQAHLGALSDSEITAVFAHELAHIERRDGCWFPLVGLLQSLLWAQPVTHWVCARVRQSAELACDDRCVELTREPLALACALTRLAESTLRASLALVAPAMMPPRSGLVARVKRLTHGAYRAERRAGPRGLAYFASSLVAVAVASLCVSVSASVRVPQAGSAAPRTAELAKRIGELARRQDELATELAALSSSTTEQAAQASVRALEAQQELEHARAMQAWLEAQLIHE